ncbi:CAF1-domain-containing protein [Neoconidiobolus thromboides FSU 785]|nr:CAF1-domain-containing protein [Neoconidiobolus thromboides FSU 785]
MLELTRENFKSHYNNLKTILSNCDFFAIDLEFTGVTLPNNRYLNLESNELRYQKLKKIATCYQPIQVGLCTFHQVNNTIEAIPVTIYLFPDSKASDERKNFTVQSNTLSFLLSNRFSFFKWIKEGLAFTRLDELNIKKKENKNGDQVIKMDDKNKDYMECIRKQIHDWSLGHQENSIIIHTNNSYQRRLVYQECNLILKQDYKLLKLDNGLRLVKDIKNNDEVENLIDITNDFSEVMKLILMNNKKMIGHNCLLDLCFIYQHFIGELPTTLIEFKKAILNCFPSIFDTKYLFHNIPELKEHSFGASNLAALMLKFEEHPFNFYNIKIDIATLNKNQLINENQVEYESNKIDNQELINYHNAGYDALITGKLLIYMICYLTAKKNENEELCQTVTFEHVKKYENYLYNMQSEFDNINLAGNDRATHLKHGRYLIQNIDTQLKTQDIRRVFESIEGLIIDRIQWVDSQHCWLQFELPKAPRLSANLNLTKEEFYQYFYNKLPIKEIHFINEFWDKNVLKKPILEDEEKEKLASMGKLKVSTWEYWYKLKEVEMENENGMKESEVEESEVEESEVESEQEDEEESEEESEQDSIKDMIEVINEDVIELQDDDDESVINVINENINEIENEENDNTNNINEIENGKNKNTDDINKGIKRKKVAIEEERDDIEEEIKKLK